MLQALSTIDPRDIVLAALFVAAGYFTLTFYDLFALRTIGRGRALPHRGAGRLHLLFGRPQCRRQRLHRRRGALPHLFGLGLDAIEVAKICFIAGLTFWLGNATVLGLGFAYVPQAASAIDQLPPWFNRVLALVTLAVLALYVAWVWRTPRIIGRDNWQVTLPGGPLTLLQIVIGIVDLAFCALAMYMLVPDEPHIGFITLAVIFVSATLLGFASHSPGGLGVFDAAMLVALWQFDKEDLLAGLLMFRLLYYIMPFALALLILGIREIMLARSERAPARGDGGAPMTTAGGDRLLRSAERWSSQGRDGARQRRMARGSRGCSADRLRAFRAAASWRLCWARCGCSARWSRAGAGRFRADRGGDPAERDSPVARR